MTSLELGEEFDNYEDLQDALWAYSETTHSVFTRRNSRSVEAANRQLRDGEPKYPKFFKYVYLKYGCKHYGEPRRNSRGIRPNQRSFKTGCPAYITISANRRKKKLVIIKCELDHSHETSSDAYKKYPEVRRISADLEDAANLLMDFKVPASSVAKQLRESSGKVISSRDIYNMRVKKIKQNLQSTTSLTDCLRKILSWNEEHQPLGHETLLQNLAKRHRVGDESATSALIEAVARPRAANEVISQAQESRERGYEITAIDESNYKVKSGEQEFNVLFTPREIGCTCSFHIKKSLPCCHIFAVYLQFPETHFNKAWLTPSSPESTVTAEIPVECVKVKVETIQSERKVNRSERYCDMHRLVKDIPEMCADLSQSEFCERYELLHALQEAWRDNKPVRLMVGENFMDTYDHTYIQQPHQTIIQACGDGPPKIEHTVIELDNPVVTHVIF